MIEYEKVTLRVRGQEYREWTDLQVVCGIEEVAWSFSMQLFQKKNQLFRYVDAEEGDDCEILIGSDLVVRGIIDNADRGSNAKSRWTNISGRSMTGQLVDNTAIHRTGSWEKATLLAIAKELCAPFKINVVASPELLGDELFNRPLINFALNSGEKNFPALARAAGLRGVLLNTNANGDLVLLRATTKPASMRLIDGIYPVEEATRQGSYTERYSHIIVKGQMRSNDHYYGDAAAKGQAIITDAEVQRYRPLIVLAESGGGREELQRRGVFERNVRAGRSRKTIINTYGYRAPNGELYRSNQMLAFTSDELNIDESLLIARVTYMIGKGGARSGLELMNRNAFDVLVEPRKRSKKKGKYQSWD